MKTIEIIKPVKAFEFKKTRVAVYARVSVEGEMNMHSLDAQVDYYAKLIKHNPRWENAGIFADYGLTGTRTDRPGFQGLLKLCDEGKVDLVLTKSISRFCRNTVDLLTTVRHLKDLDINVHFSSENIDSISSNGELLLSLLAEFATEQSRSISENTRWAIHKRFEKGIPHSVNLYGFDWDGKNFNINPKEAAVIQEIFSSYLDGKSPDQIAKELQKRDIAAPRGGKFSYRQVADMLRLEKYAGNSMLQKTFCKNFMTGWYKKNNGEETRYYAEGTHPQIITQQIFDSAQKEISRRKELNYKANQSLHFSCFTGKIICGLCGHTFRKRMTEMTHRTNKFYKWICGNKLKYGVSYCCARNVPDKVLHTLTAQVIGTENFSDQQFDTVIDHITVGKTNTLTYFLKDGTQVIKTWLSTTPNTKIREVVNG